ncbi:MAG TPA: T9SS type A sorting domain-containing protein [Bacteroidia bacterium]|nr:T9SS type A sorting domain-containing protein [Bacteroidia bacterium]
MPPWSPDSTYSRFLHERYISQDEKNKILDWIAGGTLAGDTTKAPPPPVYTQYQINAVPDLELTIPTFTSNASNDDSYVCFSLPSGLTQDRIVRAFEIVAGNPSIVHHVIANVDTMGTTTDDLSGQCYNITGDFSIGGFAPGAPPTIFPSLAPLKMGIRIKKGSKIVLQIHYPAGSAGEKDNTKIRLYFYPAGTTGIRPVIVSTPLQNWLLNIPANTVKKFTASYPAVGTLPANLSVFAAFPHSHKLATTIMNCAYKGTDTIPLIRIKQWDFNWQGYYTYRRLVKIPSGYKLFSSHIYDNTTNNPNNPNNPPQDVKAGTSTGDEMLFDSFQYLVYQAGDENINIDSLIALDPITSIGGEQKNAFFSTYAYPNPFQNKVQIGYVLDQSSHVTIEIYSMFGALLKKIETGQETPGRHEVTWDAKSQANGTYLYVIKTNTQQSYGKLNLVSGTN